MRLTDFYSASPVCSASRAALLTGRYPGNLGVRKVYFPNRGQGGMAPEHVTIAEMLRGVGYACLLYTSPSPRDKRQSRMPSSA